MKRYQYELEREISAIVADFLKDQLGALTTSVATFISANIFTIQAVNYFSPGEQHLVQDQQHWKLLLEAKSREFSQVEPLLKGMLAKVTGCEVQNIYSMFGQDGVLFEVVTLRDNLGRKLLEFKEIEL